jgi:hypothetical protein
MAFKHKLSARLALMRDALLVPLAALLACEELLLLVAPDPVVARVTVGLPHVGLKTIQRSSLFCARKELFYDV